MTACPLRLKNFAGLTLGTTLRRVGNGWLIKIPASETKNKRPLELAVPEELTSYFQTYFERVRKRMANPTETAMWVSWDGDRLAYHSIYVEFTRFTAKLFSKPINPHLFRDSAATTLATHSLKAVMAAPGLLGHTHPETTAKYYTHAGGIEASRKMNEILLRHAKSTRRAKAPAY
jgi:site-specific recombinase XerC